MSRRLRRLRDDERGVTLVLFAMIIVAVFTMVAIVLDWGQSRTDRRVNKSIADFASTAGVIKLPDGTRAAVCEARNYVLDNADFSAFESESWKNGAGADIGDPCASLTKLPCLPLDSTSWTQFTGLADSGRIKVEIRSAYSLPDSAYAEDAVAASDTGDPLLKGCDHVAVIVTQTREEGFGGVIGSGDRTTSIRSVARLRTIEESKQVAALILLERHDCDVLKADSENTRVVAKAFENRPGILQFDSAGDTASCPSPVINGKPTQSGPNIVACSVVSTVSSCFPNSSNPPTPAPLSIVGVYGKLIGTADSRLANAFSVGEYGDTEVVGADRLTRAPVDKRYLANVGPLDTEARQAVCTDTSCATLRTMPKGCTTVAAGTCTDAEGAVWRVVSNCNNLGTQFPSGQIANANVFFACALNVDTPLTVTGQNARVVVTGKLTVSAHLRVDDLRKFFVGGAADQGNTIGLEIKNNGLLDFNRPAQGLCPTVASGVGKVATLAVGKGSFKAGSGGQAKLCQTFVYMANGYGKVPTTQGTPPCPRAIQPDQNTAACDTYQGLIDIGSGATVDWSAPNELSTQPKEEDFLTKKFEDLSFWTESAKLSTVTGGGSTRMTGIFFLPNASPFKLAGNGDSSIDLNAQFIARKMHVTGGGTINLVPDPDNAITTEKPILALVR